MTALLELRENLKKIYSRNEAFILPVIKFLLSFIVLSIINGKMGYMTKLDNMAIVLIVSLLCSFLPTTVAYRVHRIYGFFCNDVCSASYVCTLY